MSIAALCQDYDEREGIDDGLDDVDEGGPHGGSDCGDAGKYFLVSPALVPLLVPAEHRDDCDDGQERVGQVWRGGHLAPTCRGRVVRHRRPDGRDCAGDEDAAKGASV